MNFFLRLLSCYEDFLSILHTTGDVSQSRVPEKQVSHMTVMWYLMLIMWPHTQVRRSTLPPDSRVKIHEISRNQNPGKREGEIKLWFFWSNQLVTCFPPEWPGSGGEHSSLHDGGCPRREDSSCHAGRPRRCYWRILSSPPTPSPLPTPKGPYFSFFLQEHGG